MPSGAAHAADDARRRRELLASLGPHTRGKGCPYLKDLDAVDFTVLEEVVRRSSSAVTAGVVDERLS